ncbi:uncharacterized protein EI97DRAFT_437350 [Westerdykella ornata]|uniref:Uncharacterized protein n=1 Tax=Westerdykella ornata TaxID=318751 RepID=A0A6A6J8K3_WESOR|nr:uncharacterized protein EI97DRAFT_437350 [Westerdykella ornata]KAF2271966.1 hypothetical protein EI97DRAFT_437350 [Westerdykella ornata]
MVSSASSSHCYLPATIQRLSLLPLHSFLSQPSGTLSHYREMAPCVRCRDTQKPRNWPKLPMIRDRCDANTTASVPHRPTSVHGSHANFWCRQASPLLTAQFR